MLGFDFDKAVSLQCFETQFEDLGKIGSGGFSVVNKVRNKRDKKIYALKMVKIKPSQLKGEAVEYLQKILSQAKIISDLNHPNVIQYHGCWINADLKTAEDLQRQQQQKHEEQHQQQQLELVMQEYDENSCGIEFQKHSSSHDKPKQGNNKRTAILYENPHDNIMGTNIYKYKEIRLYLLSQLGQYSLQKYINIRNKKLSLRKTQQQRISTEIENYKMILDIIEGLLYVHNQKIIHRDIKLQNIIVGKNNRCKIIDFGLAKKVRTLKSLTIDKFEHQIVHSDDSQRHSSSVGTRIFSSPQQSNSENYDHRTDIYSLAMVIGIMFSQYNTAHQQGELLLNLRSKKLQTFKINEKLKSLLSKCLSQQKQRPDLKQLKACVKNLLKQAIILKTQQNSKQEKIEQNYKQKQHKI